MSLSNIDGGHRFVDSTVERIDLHDLRSRHVPDVPEDVDFLLEHLNDPNFDLTQSRPPSFSSV
jgi:hypothetical protein